MMAVDRLFADSLAAWLPSSFFLPSFVELYGSLVSVIAGLFLDRRKTTIDLGASRYFLLSSRTPSFEKSSGLGKAVSTILFHSCAVPSWISNSNSCQYALIMA